MPHALHVLSKAATAEGQLCCIPSTPENTAAANIMMLCPCNGLPMRRCIHCYSHTNAVWGRQLFGPRLNIGRQCKLQHIDMCIVTAFFIQAVEVGTGHAKAALLHALGFAHGAVLQPAKSGQCHTQVVLPVSTHCRVYVPCFPNQPVIYNTPQSQPA
jgi:hypothetical protein